MRAETYDIIGTLVSIAYGEIRLALIATEQHEIDGSLRADVHQTDTRGARNRVFGIIDDTKLPSALDMTSGIENTNLRALQRIGIVEGRNLPATHFARSYIQHTAQLHAFVHILGQVCDSTELHTIEGGTRIVGECRQLQTLSTIGSYRRNDTHLNALRRVLNADYSYGRALCPNAYSGYDSNGE